MLSAFAKKFYHTRKTSPMTVVLPFTGGKKAPKKRVYKRKKKAARRYAKTRKMRHAMKTRRYAAVRTLKRNCGCRKNPYSWRDKPLASKGLTSYRYKGNHDYIMIGARSTKEALSEANRSLSSGKAVKSKLEVWKNGKYVPVN